jgi:hypothetical protein
LHPRIFGSVLIGNYEEESDLDLVGDPAETTSLLTLAAFKHEASQEVPGGLGGLRIAQIFFLKFANRR